MAQLRLIHAAVVCLAACRASEAGPTSGLTVPAGWRALPELVSAATDAAKQGKLRLDAIEAWGEPSRGCYSTWLALTAEPGERGAPEAQAERMIADLSATPALAGIAITDVVKPTVKTAESGVMSLAFARAPYRGRLRAQIGTTGVHAVLACFWNEREPIACEAACSQLVGSMK